MRTVIIFLLSIFLFGVLSCKGQKANTTYTVKGIASLHDNGKMACLSDFDTGRVIDSTLIDSGRFVFEGLVDTVSLYKVSIGQSFLCLILEEGIISVDMPNRTVSGGSLNKAFTGYFDQFYKIVGSKSRLTHFMDSTLNANSDNVVGAVVLSEMANRYGAGQIDSAVAKLSKNIVALPMVRKIMKQNEAVKKTDVGQKFTDFTIEQPDGRRVSLSDYAGKGKYILVDFWASWCAPCRAEVPNLKKIYNKYKGDKFEIVGVTVGDKAEDSQKALANDGVTWPQILNGEDTLKNLYGRRYIPYTMLIDPDGVIIANNLQGEEIEKHLVGIFDRK